MSDKPMDVILEDSPIVINTAQNTPATVAGSKAWLFWLAITFLFFPGLLHVYLLMPFPGSQNLESITFCYYLEKMVWPLRAAGGVFMVIYSFYFLSATRIKKVAQVLILLAGIGSFYITDIAYSAASMFKEPAGPGFANIFKNKVPQDYIVVGVVNNGVAKAYPITYIGYHHKVQDNVGGMPVLVTYCTMCRTARVFSPMIEGKRETFRLVGARHYNAIIEDATTKTWWYQATGKAAVGSREGQKLDEIPYQQATLAAWLQKYPQSLIMQPENQFKEDYADLKGYDVVQPLNKDSTIKNKDTLLRKSWVIGITLQDHSKAYDWQRLEKLQVANDMVADMPLLIALESDQRTFHAWKRVVNGEELHFIIPDGEQLIDKETGSVWNWSGLCIAGFNKGKQLAAIQAYQDYWHSWKNFHPETSYTARF